MYVEGEPVHAFCPLDSNPESTNRAYLTDNSVIIIKKRAVYPFQKTMIRQIGFRHRLYLIPVIAGGIIAPLGIVALINDIGALWLLMLIVFAGLILLYYGFQGGPALTVFTSIKDYDIFLREITPQLRSFIAYANWQLKSADDFLYITLTETELEHARENGVTKGKRLYMKPEEVPENLRDRIWIIDTGKQHIEFILHQENHEAPVEMKLGNILHLENLREL